MFTRADITPLSIAAATAVCAGLGLGAWASPPAHVAQSAAQGGELQPISSDDPNLARYKQVIAEQGVSGPLYIVTGYTQPVPAPVEPDRTAEIDAQIARETAAFDAQNRAWEADRTAWLQTFNAQRAQVAQPVAYVEPEHVTTEAAPAEAAPEPVAAPE
jgi:hypothetical protein